MPSYNKFWEILWTNDWINKSSWSKCIFQCTIFLMRFWKTEWTISNNKWTYVLNTILIWENYRHLLNNRFSFIFGIIIYSTLALKVWWSILALTKLTVLWWRQLIIHVITMWLVSMIRELAAGCDRSSNYTNEAIVIHSVPL